MPALVSYHLPLQRPVRARVSGHITWTSRPVPEVKNGTGERVTVGKSSVENRQTPIRCGGHWRH
jgi:hypothetical protein